MPHIARVRAIWTGGSGLPGVSTFYTSEGFADTLCAAVLDWATALENALPTVVSITVPGSGDVLDDATGALVGGWTGTGGIAPGGTDAEYAAGVGAYCNWGTDDVVAGRRVRGRTFMAPLTSANYDSDGTLNPITVGALNTVCAALKAAMGTDLLIWHRPVGGTGGSTHSVTSAIVPDKVTSLRSRRN